MKSLHFDTRCCLWLPVNIRKKNYTTIIYWLDEDKGAIYYGNLY